MDDSTALIFGIIAGTGFIFGQAAEGALLTYSHSKLEKILGDEERITDISARLKDFDGHALALSIFNSVTLIVSACGFLLGSAFSGAGGRLSFSTLSLFILAVVIVPKGLVRTTVARAPERVLLSLLGFICIITKVFQPITIPLGIFGVFMGRLFGGHEVPTEEEDAVEEILDAVSEGEAEGILGENAADYIENIMESRDRIAREIMTPRPSLLCAQYDMSLEDALKTLGEHGHSRIPIYKDNRDQIVGVLYFKDVLRHLAKLQAGELAWTEILRPPLFIPETKKINELLKLLQAEKIHIAIVLDEFGGTAGIVTVEDILEEIVGELQDEFDLDDEIEIGEVLENTVVVDAKLPIDDLNEKLDLKIPDTGEYDTVGGFLASQLGKVPAMGEEVEMEGVHFEVTEADDRKVKRVRLTLEPVEDESTS